MPEQPEDVRADLKALTRDIAALTVTLARIEERTTGYADLNTRVRSLEEKQSTMAGIGRASAQGVSWVLPVVTGLFMLFLGAAVSYLVSRGGH